MYKQPARPRARAFHIRLMAPLLGLAVFTAVLVPLGNPTAQAATSSNLNFQARLLTNTGAVVPDGSYNIDFKIYNANGTTGSVGTCSGACLWEETRKNSNSQGVQVINGYFSVNLGSVTAFPSTINWDQQLWLTMNIGGTSTGASPTWDGEMQNSGNSIALTALPYSFAAGSLAKSSGANRGTLSFNTVANNPSITLPDASGTVCLQSSSACGFIQGSGTAFIQNGNALGAAAVFGTTDANGISIITNSNTIASLSSTGAATFKNFSDSTTAFQVQNASASAYFNVNTTDGYVINNGTQDIDNIIQNPSFEASGSGDSTGWYTPGAGQAITTDSANARSGNRILQVTGNSTTHAITTKFFAVKPGDQIYVEAWVKNSAGANGDGGIYVEFLDKDKGNASYTNADTGLPGTSYVQKTITATVPASKYYVRVAASVKATSSAGTFYFDDFYMKRINQQAPLTLTTASATAFQVQNASGQTVLGVDSSANKLFTTIADGASAVGFTFNTPSYTTAGAKLLSLQNNSVEKFYVDKDGNIVNQGSITASGSVNIGSGQQFQVNGTQISSANLSNDSNLAKLNGTGPQTFSGNNRFTGTLQAQNTSATGFQVQNASNAVFTVDTSGNKVILGTASALTGQIQFQGSGGAGTLTLAGPTTPDTGNYTLTIPTITANANICSDNSICSGYASSSGLTSGLAGKLNKGSADTSNVAVTAVQGNMYVLTNTSNTIASGVLKLDNGNNTANVLTVTGSTNYSAGSAYIVINNTNGTPAGNLIDLQSNAASQFSVDATGNVAAAGNISIASGKQYQINGVQIASSNLSDGSNLAKLNANQTFSGNNTFSSASNSFTGSGAGLTSLDAGNVSSGTLNDGRLSSNVALLNRTGQTFSGDNVFAPTSNGAGTIIRQTSGTASSGSVLDVQTANGSSSFLQITNAAANEGNVTLQSVGATRDLILGSGSGTLKIAAATGTIQHSNSGLTIDINNGTDSTLTITNGQGGAAASLSVEGDVAVGAGRAYKVGATSGTGITCASNTFLQNANTLGGIVTSGACAAAVTSISAAGGSIANGASISGNALTLGYADTSNPGLVSNTTQSFNGNKTFANDLLVRTNSATAFQVQNTSNIPFMVVDTSGNNINLGITGATNANATVNIGNSSQGTQNTNIGSSNAGTVAITGPAAITGRSSGTVTNLSVTAGAAGQVGATIKGASSQTANLLQLQDSTDSNLLRVDANGNIESISYISTAFGGLGKYSNLLIWTEEFNNGGWTKTNVTNPTADTISAPDTNTTAESLADSASGGNVCQFTSTAAASTTSTFSVWLKTASSTQSVDLRIDGGPTSCAAANTVTGTTATVTATTTWQRFSVTQTIGTCAGCNLKVRIFPGGTGGSGTVHAWGAQLALGSLPLVYISVNNSDQQGGGTGLSVNGKANFTASTDSTKAYMFQNATSVGILTIDSTNNRIIIGNPDLAPTDAALNVVSQTGGEALIKVRDSTDQTVNVLTVAGAGATTLQNRTNSTTAFQVKNAAGTTAVLNADTTNNRVGVGTAAPNEALQVSGAINLGTTTNTNAGTIRWNGTDFEGYDGTQWKSMTTQYLSVNPSSSVRKSSNECVNSNGSGGCGNTGSTLQNDNELTFSVGANETWNFRFVMFGRSGTAPDFKFSVVATGSTSCTFGFGDFEGARGESNTPCGTASGLIPGTGADEINEIMGTVVNGGSATSVTVQWAQNTADTGAATIYAGSFLQANRILSAGAATLQAFVDDGNSFGAAADLGTNDAYDLNLRTNGNTIATLSSTNGSALFKNSANSTAGFQIQNAAAAKLLIADTTNSRIYVGDSAADTTGVILVLDTKSSTGDPTGVNGAMYYNSGLQVFRCYENGAWRSCLSGARTSYFFSNDMNGPTTDSQMLVNMFGSGASITSPSAVAGHPGILSASTGTTSGGQAGLFSATVSTMLLLGNNDAWSYESVLRIPTLSDATNTFTVRAGFVDDNAAESVDGCYFRYTNGTNSGRWQGVCRSNSTESTCDTGITVAANTWYRLNVSVNGAGNSADFATDGTSRCQITANIPTASGRDTGFGANILKTVGTTARTFQIDYMEVRGDLAASR